jgi:putative membrane protein
MWPPNSLWSAVLAAVLFGIVGIVLTALGFKVFEWITPKMDVEKELAERNVAVAIVAAAFILGIAYVSAHAML